MLAKTRPAIFKINVFLEGWKSLTPMKLTGMDSQRPVVSRGVRFGVKRLSRAQCSIFVTVMQSMEC
jgi:hypothetical protein